MEVGSGRIPLAFASTMLAVVDALVNGEAQRAIAVLLVVLLVVVVLRVVLRVVLLVVVLGLEIGRGAQESQNFCVCGGVGVDPFAKI
jgi:hypothetical protein